MDSARTKQERHEAQQAAFAKYEKALRKSVRMARDRSVTNTAINEHMRSAREQWERDSR